ncbi:MAG: hypothetical protein ACLU7D_09695 [Collinsella sp.]
MVLLEEKKLVEGAKAAQEAKEAAEVTVRTKYDHEAGKLLKRFKALNTARKPYQAMAVYDRLRQNYPGSAALAEAYPDAVRISAQVNRTLDVLIAAKEKSLERERQVLSQEEEKRRGNAKLTQEQRTALLDAFQKKQVALRERENQLTEVHRAHRKKVRERGDRWFEPTAGSLEAMRDIKLVASTDAERLKNQEKETGAGSAALKKAWELCDEKKFGEAEEILADIRSAQVPRNIMRNCGKRCAWGSRNSGPVNARNARKPRERSVKTGTRSASRSGKPPRPKEKIIRRLRKCPRACEM